MTQSNDPDEKDEVSRIAAKQPILEDAHKQRVLWARTTALKQVLIARGLVTEDQFERTVKAMVRHIDNTIEAKISRDLGLKDEDGTPIPPVALGADTASTPIPRDASGSVDSEREEE